MARSANPVPQYFTDKNKILVGGLMFYFEAGTSDPKPTFADPDETIQNTHPVVLDSEGRLPNGFFTNTAKQVLKDSNSVQIWERDNVEAGLNVEGMNKELISDLSQEYIFDTVASYKGFTTAFPVGKTIKLLVRGAEFTVIAGTGTANTANIIASTSVTQSIVLTVGAFIIPEQFGLLPDNTHRPVIELAMQDYANDNFTPIQWGFSTQASPYLIGDLIFTTSMIGQGKKKTFLSLRPDWTQSGGNTNINLQGNFRLTGNDLILAVEQANKNRVRQGGQSIF